MNLKQNFKIVATLGWRNVWKNKRRTILTLLTILVGTTLIILTNAFAKGGHDQMIEDAVALNSGHIQIHEKGFWENGTIDYGFIPTTQLKKSLKDNVDIDSFTTRVYAAGLLSFKDSTSGVLVEGVDPVNEKKVTTLHTNILEGGRYLLSTDKTEIVLGHILAKNLGIKVGDKISIISQGFDGSIAADSLTIVGLFKSGNPEYDRSLILMPLSQVMQTFSMMDYITSYVIRVKDYDKIETVKNDIKKNVDLEKIEVMGWDELMPELVQYIVMDDIGAYIFDIVLFLIVAFGILNTIQMAVFERTREFGVMLAIGTTPRKIISMVLFESTIITLVGIFLGVTLGTIISYYFEVNPIEIGQYADEMAIYGVNTTIFPTNATLLSIVVTSITTFCLAFIFSIFPARRASKLKPVEAIRQL